MTAATRDQTPVRFDTGEAELRMKEIGGDFSIAFVRFAQGVDMSPAFKGLPDDLCTCPHWGYVLKGKIKLHTTDGSTVYSAGEAFYWAPGHAPEAVEDTEFIDFSPTAQMEAVVGHVEARMT
ncbi:hypothetical protein ABZY57_06820 [Streptomyces sp. NPDC006450]|uniref:hypothetical protein n=1 Tax=Streptomyces sp. NPDC006450 TaxID=3155458 RepID=UPI0033B86294